MVPSQFFMHRRSSLSQDFGEGGGYSCWMAARILERLESISGIKLCLICVLIEKKYILILNVDFAAAQTFFPHFFLVSGV